jgi:hypothetical protein
VKKLLTALLLATIAAPALSATPIEEKDVVSAKAKLDPAKGYIFLNAAGRQAGAFIRIPDDADIADYAKYREEQFAAVWAFYQRSLSKWTSEVRYAKEQSRALPEKPVEPTRDTFYAGAIETRTIETFGPERAYTKGQMGTKDGEGGAYTYLTAVKPGTYIWYGPVMFNPQYGYSGICYCMGSVKFEVKPGIVTDLGNFLVAAPEAEKQTLATIPTVTFAGAWSAYKVELPEHSQPVRHAIPPSLKDWPVAEAEFSASGKTNNFFNVIISRLPAVPGVLGYDRDVVIDAKTGTRLASAMSAPVR